MTQRGSLETVLGSMRYSWCQCQCDPVDVNVGKLRLSGSHWNSVFGPHWRSLEFIGGSLRLSGVRWASVGVVGA